MSKIKESLRLKSKKDLYLILLGCLGLIVYLFVLSLNEKCFYVFGSPGTWGGLLCWIVGPEKYSKIVPYIFLVAVVFSILIFIYRKSRQNKT